ncbi:MAG: S8 family serine peptidase [Clostridiales Family XIII bacterium]|jgi:subtilisin family serine protease|nr:S8 family serine peptidase [Clostridiales Family XIII bacterium]
MRGSGKFGGLGSLFGIGAFGRACKACGQDRGKRAACGGIGGLARRPAPAGSLNRHRPTAFLLALALCLPAFGATASAEGGDPLLSLFSGDMDAPHDGYLVMLKEGAPQPAVAEGAEEVVEGLYRAETLEDALGLAAPGHIEAIEPDYSVWLYDEPIAGDPSDSLYGQQWGLKDGYGINASAAWRLGLRGGGATIAVVDSGVRDTHEDFEGLAISTHNAIDGSTSYSDEIGHGTMVSGIISAQTDNGKGVAGIADKAAMMSVKMFGAGGGRESDLIAGIKYAADNGADVINMSLGSTAAAMGTSAFLKAAVNGAIAKGAILVAAVGNDGNATQSWPASFPNVTGVGSIGSGGSLSSFSQRISVDVLAPGEGMHGPSHSGDSAYTQGAGTSFAAPVVAAMAGIAKSVSKGITGAGFEALLERSSKKDGALSGGDAGAVGYGRADMAAFVDWLTTAHAISYVLNDGQLSPGAVDCYYTSTGALLPGASSVGKGGAVFAGWYDNPGLSGQAASAVPAGALFEKTFYAKWLPTGAQPANPSEPPAGGGGGGGGGGGMPAAPVEKEPSEPEEAAEKPASEDSGRAAASAGSVDEVFSDVEAGSWYRDYVQAVYDGGYFVGTGEGSFSPDGEMTRAMFITVLGRMAKIDPGSYAGRIFDDVRPSEWFGPYVAWGYGSGIIDGMGEGLFGGGLPVTREQMAVMAYKYAVSAGLDGSRAAPLDFVDSGDVSPWASDALMWAYGSGIMQGKPGNILDPGGTATRAEVAAIVVRLDALLAGRA